MPDRDDSTTFIRNEDEDGQWAVKTISGWAMLTIDRRGRGEIVPSFGADPEPVPVRGRFDDIMMTLDRLVAEERLAQATARNLAAKTTRNQVVGKRRRRRARVSIVLLALAVPIAATVVAVVSGQFA